MHDSWREFLKNEFDKPYFQELSEFLSEAYRAQVIFPQKERVFSAFSTDFKEIKVVILGQDPYHTPGAAHGLAFSVPPSASVPPSLKNIYKEILADTGRESICAKRDGRDSGYLGEWQKQGVLLLNNVLTVEAHKAGSHRGKGWEIFTEAVVRHLNDERENLVFILWGRDARNKRNLIDGRRHLILEAAHPSPLSAYNGFFGCRHFTKTNQYLKEHNLQEIQW